MENNSAKNDAGLTNDDGNVIHTYSPTVCNNIFNYQGTWMHASTTDSNIYNELVTVCPNDISAHGGTINTVVLKNTYIFDPNPAPNGTVYANETFWWSPIKIALNNINAKLNSTDGFNFALKGLGAPSNYTVKTSGGLNNNEAWLFMDRGIQGTWVNNTLDNDDLFGDHMGKYLNGYEELKTVFASQLQTDSNGNQYIPLDTSFWHQTWISIMRFFGNKTPDAARDLKLLTRDRQILNASDYLQRLYVNNWNTMEVDKTSSNAIFQRSWVETKQGRFTQSADQWFHFKSQLIRKATPDEARMVRKQLGFKK